MQFAAYFCILIYKEVAAAFDSGIGNCGGFEDIEISATFNFGIADICRSAGDMQISTFYDGICG